MTAVIDFPCEIQGCTHRVKYMMSQGKPIPQGPHICMNHPNICPYGYEEIDHQDITCMLCSNIECLKPER